MNKREFIKNIVALSTLIILPTAVLACEEKIRKVNIVGKIIPEGVKHDVARTTNYRKNASMSHIKKDDVWYYTDDFTHPYIATSDAYLTHNKIWGVDAINWDINVAN